ncbi:MAG: ATP-binding protein [Agriterribacter sp.]
MILIVDDKQENIFSLQAILARHSFPTDTASSGEEALKKILKRSYALIILDVQMPGMDGFEVAEIIAGYQNAKDTPILFLSAVNTDKRFITKGYAAGGIDYITKPFDPDILMLKVKTFYRLYEQTHALNEMQRNLLQEVEFRRNAQNEIQEKVQQLHTILESIPQIAFTAGPDGTIEFVNKQWYLYSADMQAFPATHPEDIDIGKAFKTAVANKEPLEMEVRVKKVYPNQYKYHLLRVMPVKEGDTVVKWVGTFTDIDAQKQVASKKDEFISIASHELKTPLASVKAYIQLLERQLETADKVRPLVERSLTQIDKLNRLVSELLDVSKIESGKMRFHKEVFDFNKLLGDVVDIMQKAYPHYTIVVTSDPDLMVYADEMRIEQVITNYITNAVKYSPEVKRVEVSAKRTAGNMLEFSVKDFGIGIPLENQQEIFEKFFRAENVSASFQGLGIGLFVSAEIINRHQGTYRVESASGKGSVFYFTIPMQPAPAIVHQQ